MSDRTQIIAVLGALVVIVAVLVANAISPYPKHFAKRAFGVVVKFVCGYDPAYAVFAIDSHADLRAHLAKVLEQRDDLAHELAAAGLAVTCCEEKCANYERALEAILEAQTVPLGYAQGLARAALHANLSS